MPAWSMQAVCVRFCARLSGLRHSRADPVQRAGSPEVRLVCELRSLFRHAHSAQNKSLRARVQVAAVTATLRRELSASRVVHREQVPWWWFRTPGQDQGRVHDLSQCRLSLAGSDQ